MNALTPKKIGSRTALVDIDGQVFRLSADTYKECDEVTQLHDDLRTAAKAQFAAEEAKNQVSIKTDATPEEVAAAAEAVDMAARTVRESGVALLQFILRFSKDGTPSNIDNAWLEEHILPYSGRADELVDIQKTLVVPTGLFSAASLRPMSR